MVYNCKGLTNYNSYNSQDIAENGIDYGTHKFSSRRTAYNFESCIKFN